MLRRAAVEVLDPPLRADTERQGGWGTPASYLEQVELPKPRDSANHGGVAREFKAPKLDEAAS